MPTDDIANMSASWPKLPPLATWQDTCVTIHMWSQIVGKIRLGLAPQVNHFWGCTLYVTTCGLTTSPMPSGAETLTIDFDFIDHELRVTRSDGHMRSFALEPMPVATFYSKTMQAPTGLGNSIKICARPVEVVETIPFPKDIIHASYDADAIRLYWRVLVTADRVFKDFRARFIGKASPSHFFWGSFDLAATRFSGRTAPKHSGGVPNCPYWVMMEAYSHELSSAGFWPGTGLSEAAFYSYAYPSSAGFGASRVQPDAAYFDDKLGEFILPYEAARTAENPTEALLSFLQTTYAAAANLADWNRAALDRRPGVSVRETSARRTP